MNTGIQYLKGNVTTISGQDKRAWELISDTAHMPKKYAYICALANILIAGAGTMVSAFMNDTMNKTQLLVGIVQLLLAPYLVGYLWSFYWAYKFIISAGKPANLSTSVLTTNEGNMN